MDDRYHLLTTKFIKKNIIVDYLQLINDIIKALYYQIKTDLVNKISKKDLQYIKYTESENIEIKSFPDFKAVRLIMKNSNKQCFTVAMIEEMLFEQKRIIDYSSMQEIDYLIMESASQKCWSQGTDLDFLLKCIDDNDVTALHNYTKIKIEYLINNLSSYHTTIALIDGCCFGSGFEMALSCDYIIAEKQASFSFPEIIYGLFPGTGAYSFLSRKVGINKARAMISKNHIWKADELFALGLIHEVIDQGGGENAVKKFMEQHKYSHGASKIIDNLHQHLPTQVTKEELTSIAELWIKQLVSLDDKNMAILKRLADVQSAKCHISKC